MEYINIISKEPIIALPDWITHLILGVCFLLSLIPLIYALVTNNFSKTIGLTLITGICVIVFEVAALIFCSANFSVPTGRYRYEGTIDKDKVTVGQYEEFIEKYNPTIKDGIYYWEE
jgi:hypothetical protein